MYKLTGSILLLLLFSQYRCPGQDAGSGSGFQTIMMHNPAFTGNEGDGTVRFSYLNYYPGRNYKLHSMYFSYDSYFPLLHGGAGFYVSDDYLGGIINDLRGGLSYSYFLQAGDDFFINAGMSASFIHRGLTFNGAVFPDQIDPLGGVAFPTSEIISNKGSTIFDIGAGFVIIAGNLFGGVGVSHLAEPVMSIDGFQDEHLKRKVTMNFSGDFSISKASSIVMRPLFYFILQGDYLAGAAGMEIDAKYIAVNMMMMANNEKTFDMQSGFSVKTGKISLFYNYRFNLISSAKVMPFSLLHSTGLQFSLYNVDKRNIIKTINFPKL